MFKPFYGTCVTCETPNVLIVVKKGYCGPCNHRQKEARKGNHSPVIEAQDVEGYTRVIGIRRSKKPIAKRSKRKAGRKKKGDARPISLRGITNEHTYVYLKTLGYSTADFIPCELDGGRAVDIHHIFSRGMGGSDQEDEFYNRIENLMALTRENHEKYGDRKQFYDYLIEKHFEFLEAHGIDFDRNFFLNYAP